jgi:hypothetical protein
MATKPSLEKAGKNFSEHISDFHNIWKYLYFLIYLNSKNKENINGIEDIVYDQFINGKAEWVPSESRDGENSSADEKPSEIILGSKDMQDKFKNIESSHCSYCSEN